MTLGELLNGIEDLIELYPDMDVLSKQVAITCDDGETYTSIQEYPTLEYLEDKEDNNNVPFVSLN